MVDKNSRLDYGRLLEEAKEGCNLPKDVLKNIREQLNSGEFETDPYILLHLLGITLAYK
jgi:hypothetical protein